MYIKCEIGELLILCAKIHNYFHITKLFYTKWIIQSPIFHSIGEQISPNINRNTPIINTKALIIIHFILHERDSLANCSKYKSPFPPPNEVVFAIIKLKLNTMMMLTIA